MTVVTDPSPPTHAPAREAVAAAIYFPVRDLRAWGQNYRRNHRVVELARTILRTRWGAPILAQRSTRRIIGGHGRSFAALAILEGIEVDGFARGGADHYFDPEAPAPGMVPVRFLDVSDAEADALAIADNAKGLQGEDDVDLLVEHLGRFGIGTALLADMGYTAEAVERLLAGAGAEAQGAVEGLGAQGDDEPRPAIVEDEPEVDRADELRAKWGTALGQLWEIPSATVAGGVHRILCGDSTRAADVERLLGGERARWCWTDPPYGVEYKGGTGLTIENDGAEGLPELLRGAFASMDAALVEGAPIYVAHPSGPLSFVFAEAWQRAGWRWHQTLCWVKNTFVLGHADYHHQFEPILYGWKGKNRPWYGGRAKASTLFFDKPARNAEHPTMKPVALVAECILNSSRRGERGFEPFSGSGTTLAAGEQCGRLVSAIELAPKYVAVALERLAATGLAPRLVA